MSLHPHPLWWMLVDVSASPVDFVLTWRLLSFQFSCASRPVLGGSNCSNAGHCTFAFVFSDSFLNRFTRERKIFLLGPTPFTRPCPDIWARRIDARIEYQMVWQRGLAALLSMPAVTAILDTCCPCWQSLICLQDEAPLQFFWYAVGMIGYDLS